MTPFNKKIQELILSNDRDNIQLAESLLDDPNQLYYWIWSLSDEVEPLNLVVILYDYPYDAWAANWENKHPKLKKLSTMDCAQELKLAYEYLESQNTRINT